MNDTQVMTLSMAIVIPLAMLIYSNSRITDCKEVLRAEMQKGQAEIIASMEKLAAQVKSLETMVENKLTIHELEHHR